MFRSTPNAAVGIMCGLPSNGLVVLDFDSSAGLEKACSTSPRLASIVDQTLVVKTRRGVHVYLRTSMAVVSAKIGDFDLEIRAQGQYVVAPGNTIGNFIYTSERDADSIVRLSTYDELGFVTLQPWIMPSATVPRTSERDKAILAGDAVTFPSRSEAEMSIIVRLVKDGHADSTIVEFFERNARPGGKFGDLTVRQRQSYLRRSTDRARHYVESNRTGIDTFLDAAEQVLQEYPHPARTQLVDRAVSAAVLRIARRAGKYDRLTLSNREIALEACISRNAAGAALRRSPILTKTDEANSFRPAEYRLDDNFVHTVTSFIEGMPVIVAVSGCKGDHVEMRLDLFRQQGLGRLAGTVFGLLNVNSEPMTKEEVRQCCTVSLRSIERALVKLRLHGLIETVAGGVHMKYRAVPHTADEIARLEVELGVHGYSHRERNLFERERDEWRAPRDSHRRIRIGLAK